MLGVNNAVGADLFRSTTLLVSCGREWCGCGRSSRGVALASRRGSWARGALNTSAQVSPFAGPCTPRSRRGTATHPTFQAILGGWLTRLQMARVASGHLHRLSLYVYHRRLPLPCAALRGNLRHLTLRHRHSLVQRRAALVVHLCALLLRSMVTVALLHLTYLPRLALLAMACSRDRLLAARLSLRTRLRLCRARLRPLRAPPNTPTPRPMVAAALTRHRPLISRLALLALVHLWEHLLVPLILLTNLIHHLNRLLTLNLQPSIASCIPQGSARAARITLGSLPLNWVLEGEQCRLSHSRDCVRFHRPSARDVSP